MKASKLPSTAITDTLTAVAAEFGQPAQDTICLENFGKHHFEVALILELQERIGDCAQILDVGGGMGVNVLCLRRLCKKSVELSLVDQFEEYVAGNRMGEQSKGLALMQKAGISALPHNIWRNDRLPFETESFDIITILDVVEHLPGNPFRVLSEINRLLRKGGLLILGGPNAISLTKRIKLLVGKHPYMPFEEWCKDSYYSHYREYAPAEYAALIERSGLSVERIHLVPEPTRTLARNHYRNGRHRVLSLTSIGLYGLQILDGVFQSIRPSVYCVAVKSRNVKTG